MAHALTHDNLAAALQQAVRDALDGAPRFDPAPNLDLAVVALPHDAAPVWANLLFSRERPRGLVAQIGADAGAVQNIRYLADPVDARQRSIAWQSGSDWTRLPPHALVPLAGDGPQRFIAPYPASLVKLMVAVGVAHLVDSGRADWHQPWPQPQVAGGQARTLAQQAEAMLVSSSNDATDALVALLHARGLIRREAGHERNGLHDLFEQQGLHTLRLADTTPTGGWRNADGAGVGHLQMTAWDTVRLLWRLLDDAPPSPWLRADTPQLLSAASRRRLWGWLAEVRPAHPAADARYAHKTGNTESYASDAGLVEGDGGRRYLIALMTTLGARHAPPPAPPTGAWVQRIVAAVDKGLKERLE